MKFFLLVVFLAFSSCATKSKLELRSPAHIPKPEKNKSAERAIQGLNNMSRYINSADSRVEKIKQLVDGLETAD
jgi:hypothetical protein